MKLTTVGVKDIKFPVRIREKSGSLQETVASISLHADIPKRYRETCVSTFIAALNKHQDDMSANILAKLLSEVQDDLQAEAAHLEMTFPYFIDSPLHIARRRGSRLYIFLTYLNSHTPIIGKREGRSYHPLGGRASLPAIPEVWKHTRATGSAPGSFAPLCSMLCWHT